jgi:N-acetyl-anhydromuramyl-L-alanine amidase AmpD
VPEQRVAWHAGKGSFGEEKYENSLNKYSIGIELLAIGSKNDMKQYLTSRQYNSIPKHLIGYTDAQYEALSALISDIIERWDIPADRQHIIGHDEYNPNKSDPGELFDWERLMGKIQ